MMYNFNLTKLTYEVQNADDDRIEMISGEREIAVEFL